MPMTIEELYEYFGVEPLPNDPDDPRTPEEREADEAAKDLEDTQNSVRP